MLLCHFPAFFSLNPQLSLRSNPSFLKGTGLSDIFGLSFYNVDKKWSVHTPSSFAQDLCWKVGPTRTSGMALHFEIVVVATLLLLTFGVICINSVNWQAANIIEPITLQEVWVAPDLKDEKNAGKWQSNRFLQNDTFFGSGSKHASKIHIQKNKSNIRAKYTSLQNVGVLQRAGWCTKPYHFVWSFVYLHRLIL